MRYFKEIAKKQGINVMDVNYGGSNGVLVANSQKNREDMRKVFKNPVIRVTYIGEVVDNNLIYTRR